MHGLDFVPIADLLYCHADGNYTEMYTIDGERYVVSRTLSDFEELLKKHHFFRCHKSYLVNLAHIKRYIRGSGGQVVLKDGTGNRCCPRPQGAADGAYL